MPVDYKVVLVPDLFGSCVCKKCHGYGWSHGYNNDTFTRLDCEPCEGSGWFREETEIIPSEDGSVLQSEELSRDSYGRYIHRTCNGGGIRFFIQCGDHYWSCTSCNKWGVLSPPEWKLAQDMRPPPLNLFANARGADLLYQFRSTL